ncbi:MAG: hemerythrin family protein [Xanthomonadales bacterium]|nr:hemerythrin family protein [Xanthomonadales bacterium]MDH4019866.1 hemerythrin family protein [Xanthomonadales bacterium]
MAQIEWKEEYSIGNASVDEEHELLITQINKLYQQLNQPLDTMVIESMLSDIQTDISTHFALEELLMQEAGFAEFEDHKQDHERLLDQISDMIFHFTEDPESGRELLINRLSDWFSNHFRGFDSRLHNQLC